MFNYKNKQTAGALLGEGSYGCVFRPNLRCEEGQFSEKDSRFISKLVNSENEYEEYDNFEKFKFSDIDPNQKYLVYPLAKCNIPNNVKEDDINKCGVIRRSYHNDSSRSSRSSRGSSKTQRYRNYISDKFTNIIQKYSGESLDKHRKNNRIYECKDYVLMYLSIMKGALLLNVNNLSQRDIKLANVVVNEREGRYAAKLIDYSIQAQFVDDIDQIDNDWANFSKSEYEIWPLDLTIYCSVDGGSYNRFKERVDRGKNITDKIQIVLKIADELLNWREYEEVWVLSSQHLRKLYTSCVEFLTDLFIKGKFTEDNKIDKNIQKKWDVFMIGCLLSMELKEQRIEDDDGDLDSFFEEFALLIMTMTTLHPIERISIRDCITAFMELLNKYRLELELDRKTLEEEQDEIDTILDEKKI